MTLTDANAHAITLGLSGSDLQISVNGVSLGSRPLSEVSGVSITGVPDLNDTLTVDLSGGAIPVPIFFDGGAGGYDTLVISGSNAPFVSTATGPQSGQVAVGSTVITYAGLEPVTNTGSPADAVYSTGAGDDDATLTATGGNVTLTSNNATFETTTVTAPSTSLTINLNGGNDSLTIGDISGYTALLTIDGGANSDTLSVTSTQNMTLTGTTLTVGSRVITVQNFETVKLTGGSGSQTFTVHDFAGATTLTGGASADTYVLGDHFGQVTIAGGAADTIDFTTNTGTLSFDGTNFTDGEGDTATISGTAPSHIDVTFAAPATIKTDVENILDSLKSAVSSVDSASNSLSTLLPLLDPSAGSSIDKIVALVDSVGGVADQVSGALANHATLSGIATQLNSIVGGLPDVDGVQNPLKGLQFGTGYGNSASGDLLVYLTATLTAPDVTTCTTNGNGCVSRSIPLAFGTRLDSIGIALDSDPNTAGVQPPTFTVRATIGANLALGVDVTSVGTAFLKDGGHVDLAVDASLSAANLVISMGLLSATIGSGTIDLGGTITLQLTDPTPGDNGILPSDLPAALSVVNGSATLHSPIELTATVGANLMIAGSSTVPLAHATLDISFANDFTPQTVQIFGAGSQPLQVNAQVTTGDGGGASLLDTFSNSLTSSFSNAGPNQIISMLGQVAGFFSSIAGQSFLGQQIPFTSITLGQALDYAQEFRHEILDPLFKSGDSTKPDANGDGKVDFNDFNFSSIQDLLDRLDAALGLAPHTLTATFNPSDGTLTFGFSLDQTFGIGTGVDIAPAGGDVVDSAPLSGGTKFTLASPSAGNYTIAFGSSTSGTVAFGADVAAVSSAVAGLSGLPSGTIVTCENGAANCAGGPFKVTFNDGSYVLLTPNEVQQIVLGASTSPGTGTFAISTASSTVGGISSSVSLATFTTDVNTLLGAGVARVACANGTSSCDGGPFQVVFDGSSVAGTDVPLIAIDSSKLTNANNLVQVLTVPSGTGNFWVAYPNGSNALELTDQLSGGIVAADLKTAIQGLSGLSGHVGSVTEVDGDSTAYVITLTGLTPAKTLSVAGGFSLDFGASLGGLASVKTTGNVIPLARLIASATFGIDLNPTSSITVSPGQFQAGPRVDATTTNDGGKSISLSVIRPGVVSEAGTVQILTVNAGGGTFSLGGVSGISPNAGEGTLVSDIESINPGSYTGHVHVTKNPQQAGNIYTISFDASVGPVAALTTDGTQLTARDEVQQVNVVNADSGTFTLTFGGAVTTQLAPDAATGTVQSELNGLPSISGHGTVAVSGSPGQYTITFGGGLGGTNVGDITADNSQLTGALSDGNLNDPATFSVSITNESAVFTAISKDGKSSVSVSTIADGGSGLGVNTVTGGSASANEVQTVLVRASAGSFTLTFNSAMTGSLAWNVSAAALQSALAGLAGIGGGNVLVSQSTTVGGTLYTITFQGALADANQPQLVPSAVGGLTARDEVQQLSVVGAAGGTFTLAYDANSDGTYGPTEITAPIAYNASAGDIQTALTGTALGGGSVIVAQPDLSQQIFTITFQNGMNVKPIVVNDTTSLVSQNEVQQVTLLDATGGTFTLTLDAKTTAPIAYDAAAGDVQTALNALSNINASGGSVSVTGSAGNYVVTFDGGPLAAHHANKLVGDAGGLENSIPLGTLTVTGFTATGDTTTVQLLQKLQTAIDAAAVSAGLTPGFVSQLITSAPFTASSPVYGGGTAPNDQAFEIDIPFDPTSGSFTIAETSGNFTLTYSSGGQSATTPLLAAGASAALVQSSLDALSTFSGGSATVTQNGTTYTVSLSGGSLSNLSGQVTLTGSAGVATDLPSAFAAGLQSALRSTLSASGLAYQPTVTIDGSNELVIASGDGSFGFGLVFPSPVVASAGASQMSLSAPQVLYTFDPSQPVIAIDRHVDVSVEYGNSAFQQLGLASSPVRLTYSAALTPIDFTLFVNEAQIPVSISASDLSSVSTIDDLIGVLQSQINSAISDAFNGGALPSTGGLTAANYAVTVCRPNINPAGEKCDHVGNRIEFDVITDAATRAALLLPATNAITSLSMDVFATLDDGSLNGAVTELGFPAVTGATQRGKAGTFFLDNVNLTGQLEVAIQNVSVTASLGFLAIAATAQGTQDSNTMLLDLSATIALKNPSVVSSDPQANRLDLGVLTAALTNGEFLYDSTKAGIGGSSTDPPTGFFSGTLSGGFGSC